MILSLQLLSVLLFFKIFSIQCEVIQKPTLKPASPFNAQKDAEDLYRVTGAPGHESDIDFAANLWFHRTNEQRLKIIDVYVKYYVEGSLDDLFEDSAWSPESLLGATMHAVTNNKWEEKGALEEIVCAEDKQMKDRIDAYYKTAFQMTVGEDLARATNQEYVEVMQQYCWKGQCQEKKINPADADNEARALRAIDPKKDKEAFKKKLKELLAKHCEPDLKMIFEKYRQDNNGINDAVSVVFEDDETVRRAYDRLVRYIEDTCKFYADELHKAVDGLGTDTDRINRIILTRAERDLGCILDKYKELHGEIFTERLKNDVTESRYLKCIRFLCGEND